MTISVENGDDNVYDRPSVYEKLFVYLHYFFQDYIVYFNNVLCVIQFYRSDVKHLQENSNNVNKPKDECDYQFAFYHEFFFIDYIYNVICV